MKANSQSKKQALPLFIVGLALALGNSAIAGPQSMLDPYFGVQPVKPDADGATNKKPKKKASKVQKDDSLKTAKSDLDSYPDTDVPVSKTKSSSVLAKEPVGKLAKEPAGKLAKEPVSKKEQTLVHEPVKKQTAALVKEPVKKVSTQLASDSENAVGVIAGSKEMAHGLMVTTKGAGSDIYHGAKFAGHGVVTSSKYVASGLRKAGNGTLAAGSKVKNGTLAMGGKIKDGTGDVIPKAEQLPKAIASGIKTGCVKVKDGTVATGHAIAHATEATKDKIAGMLGGGGGSSKVASNTAANSANQ